MSVDISLQSLAEKIRSSIQGRLISPDDETYDKTRTVFYGNIDRRPAFIVQVANAKDVAFIVSLAAETGMELAIRSGGHSVAGHSSTEGGIVIDLSRMKGLDIDLANRSAWAETGLTAGEFTAEVGKHNLATGFGDTGSVGIGGITLGGGVGYLVRKYGLTIDSLLAAEIVSADGQIRQVSETQNPDLFWAIRGGGGNFGVITRFQFRLHDVSQVIGGILILPASAEILEKIVALSDSAPEELSMIVNVMTAPPMPFLPQEYHGQLITFVLPVYTGSVEEGEKALAPFRAIAKPIVDMLKPMSYPDIHPPEEDYHPVAASRTMFLDSFDAETAKTIFKHLGRASAMMNALQIRALGGAMARVADDATAFAHRQRKFMVNVAALFQDPKEAATQDAWVKAFAEELHKDDATGYVNFLGDEGVERVRAAYPGGTWERLREIKAKYDPKNLFRLNQNIPPAN
jgi:FAD/FMN-containing dehydrogenase